MHCSALFYWAWLLISGIICTSVPGYQVKARSNSPTVDLDYAKYTGIVNETTGIAHFLGVRYAAAPTGTLRWRAPQAPELTPGVQLAGTQPPPCYNTLWGLSPVSPFRNGTFQTGQAPPAGFPNQSEDCLFLNVYTPGIDQQELLPVIVWIHGGGYISGDIVPYYGDHLLEEAGGRVVFVAMQYRLGVFGFLAGKAIKQDGDLNAGLLDQQFALKWVQEHIYKFGGDPEKVTIWGVSAGGGSVLQHVIAHDGDTDPPLFHAAMTNSAFLPPQHHYDEYIPEVIYNEVLSQTGCSTSSDALTCLRHVDVNIIQNANTNIAVSEFFHTFIFVPVVDGTFITQRPTVALHERKINGRKLLSFTSSHEGNIFVNQSVDDIRVFITQLFPTFGQKEIEAAAAQYADLGSAADQANAIVGEAIFICPTYFLQHAFSGQSFKGEFAIPPGLHGSDEAYLFPPSGNPPPYSNKEFIDAFGQAFTDFSLALDPNVKADPTNITPCWERWNGKVEMLFNRTEDGFPVIEEIETPASVLKRCRFWKSVAAIVGQ